MSIRNHAIGHPPADGIRKTRTAIREGSAPRPASRLRGLTVTAAAIVAAASTLAPVVVPGGLPAATRLVLLGGGALVLFIAVAARPAGSSDRWRQ